MFYLQDVAPGLGWVTDVCGWSKSQMRALGGHMETPERTKIRQNLRVLPHASLAPTQSPSKALTLQFPSLLGSFPHRWGGTWRLKAVIWGTCKSSGWDLQAQQVPNWLWSLPNISLMVLEIVGEGNVSEEDSART